MMVELVPWFKVAVIDSKGSKTCQSLHLSSISDDIQNKINKNYENIIILYN